MTHNINSNIEKLLLTVALMASSMLFCGIANAEDQSEAKYDLLFISHGSGGEQVHVEKRTDGNKRKTIYKDKSAYKAIKWAIRNGRVTAILKGEYLLSDPIRIKRDRRTIIVPPDVTLTHKSDKEGFPVIAVIEVVRADNCRVFTFGLLEQTGTTQEGVAFKGQRADGRSGINGGLLIGTSELRNMGSGYSLLDTDNVHLPLIMGRNFGQSLVVAEGAYNTAIGALAGLGTRKGAGEGELIDLNGHNKNFTFDTVIGTAPMKGDEIVDINNSHNVTINRLLAFFGTGRPGLLAVGLDLYPDPGAHDNRAKSGGELKENKNVVVKSMERNDKKVARFNRKVTLPGYPDSLPELTIKVNLSVDFEDGTTQTLIDNKVYRYDLSKDLDLAPAAVRLLK